VSAIFF